DEAHTRVVILPFADQTGVPGLSQQLAQLLYASAAGGLDSEHQPFTELVDPAQVNERVTVDQLTEMPRESAVRLARQLHADRVVFGRVYGLRSNTDSDHYHETIWHRVTERDTSGKSVDRYVDVPFEAVVRERDVSVRYELEVFDLRSRTSVDTRTDDLE